MEFTVNHESIQEFYEKFIVKESNKREVRFDEMLPTGFFSKELFVRKDSLAGYATVCFVSKDRAMVSLKELTVIVRYTLEVNDDVTDKLVAKEIKYEISKEKPRMGAFENILNIK